MKNIRINSVIVGVAIAALALSGCSDPGTPGTPPATMGDAVEALGGSDAAAEMDALYAAAKENGENSVFVYGPGEGLYGEAYKLFMQRYPDIQVTGEFIFGAELTTRLQQEFATGQHVASVLTTGAPEINAATLANQCTSFAPTTSSFLDPKLVGPDHRYQAVAAWPVGIAYNTDMISESELPSSSIGISDPQYAGKFVIGDPTTISAASISMAWLNYAGLIDEQWVADVAANDYQFRPNSVLALQAVATGEAAFDPFASYVHMRKSIRDGLPVGFVYPRENSRAEYQYNCLLEGAPNPNASQLFINWLYSPEGQNALVKEAWVFGIRPGSDAPEGLPTYEEALKTAFQAPPPSEASAIVKAFLEVTRKYFTT